MLCGDRMLLEEELVLGFKHEEILTNLYVDAVLKNGRTSLLLGGRSLCKNEFPVLVPLFLQKGP